MSKPEPDTRSFERRALDEQIAAESPLPLPEFSPDTPAFPLEVHLERMRARPLAVMGVVENGLVRPLDPGVKLLEHSRVIIVATTST